VSAVAALVALLPALLPALVPLDLASWAKDAVGGSMALAIPVAVLAGLVSFFSPCVLPLLPGYLSYATGLAASDIVAGQTAHRRRRIMAGTGLFVLGFAAVFVSQGALFGGLGSALHAHQRTINVVVGVLAVGLGLIFADLIPLGQRTVRLQTAPRVGVAAAPLLGVVFGIGWTPCIGPALGIVLSLAVNEATAARGALLAAFYALGLGLPFLAFGLAFGRLARTLDWVKRHHLVLQRLGGALMIAVGLLLITGLWDTLMAVLREWAAGFGTVI